MVDGVEEIVVGVDVTVAVGLGREEVVADGIILSVDAAEIINGGSDVIGSSAMTLLAGEVKVGVDMVKTKFPEMLVGDGEGNSP